MISLAVAALLSLGILEQPSVVCSDAAWSSSTLDNDLQDIYESGRPYSDFLSSAKRRAELWIANTEKAEDINSHLVARARAVGGSWKLLAVAIDSCSDSVSTIPYLAQLVDMVDGLEMRVVDPTTGLSIMESHRTLDGRASTPTIILLNEDFDEVGCFIERPPALKDWILEEDFSSQEIYPQKMEWYDRDSGYHTVEIFVEMLEAAASGAAAICS
tara:strand:+ start:2125 stop:2769 length:645 start_codon:yes stop_codon:yes gene_type:complete